MVTAAGREMMMELHLVAEEARLSAGMPSQQAGGLESGAHWKPAGPAA
jgi:hypothetical protein